MKRRSIIFIVLILCNFDIAFSAQSISDTEVKALYCYHTQSIALKGLLAPLSPNDQADPIYNHAIDETRLNIERLKRHSSAWALMPHSEIIAVKNSAISDMKYIETLAESCDSACGKPDFSTEETFRKYNDCSGKCIKQLENDETGKRVNSCNDLSWLPY